MPVIERGLIRAINSGRCFALVGSGPSCEIGIPSWHKIAQLVFDALQDKIDNEAGQNLISERQYPKFFSLAEKAIGLSELLKLIKDKTSGQWPQGQIYQHITRWPFQNYLTTNFDNELQRHLKEQGESFVIRRNSLEDMRVLHSDVRQVVFKIHGDFDVPDDIVLTYEQYNDFRTGEERKYWRDNILSFLKMSNVVIIGYSASDPDFNDQLERLKDIAAPDHPIYMFVSGLSQNQIDEYFDHNIYVISYKNDDGTHSELRRTLSRYGVFITNRRSPSLGLEPVDTETARVASSLYLFTNLRLIDDNNPIVQRAFAFLLLRILSEFGEGANVDVGLLVDKAKEKMFAITGVDPNAVQASLEYLYSLGFIDVMNGFSKIVLNRKGTNAVAAASARQKLAEDKFLNFCAEFIRRQYTNLTEQQTNKVTENLKIGIIKAFERRGIEIARFIFTDEPVDISDATDILDIVNSYSAKLEAVEEKIAFADLMIEIILKPNETIKEYLSSLCQGYFSYHALGLDPTCSSERLNIARQSTWILDSSIILPLLAIDCLNHSWANDLLQRMDTVGLKHLTTERLFSEVLEHARWAISNFIDVPIDSPSLLKAANATAGYKQNLFIDGFVKWSVRQAKPTLNQYMIQCLGSDYRTNLESTLRSKMKELGIEIMELTSWPFFKQELWVKRDELASEIAKSRKTRGTWTGDDQCNAEAEAIIICDNQNTVFVSQSSFLNRLSAKQTRIAWKPEVMYQFLTLFSSAPADIDVLYQCMSQDFFAGGFDIVDVQAIANFSSGIIRQSRMDLEKERESYIEVLGEQRVQELEGQFDKTPDEYKPFYSMQFAMYVIGEQRRQLESAQKRVVVVQTSQALTAKERQEYLRLKSSKAERIRKQKKKKRKIQSQPKKRKSTKRKK